MGHVTHRAASPRGERAVAAALVAAQFGLIGVLAAPARSHRPAGLPHRPGSRRFRRAVSLGLLGGGGGLALAGALALGPGLTPSPLPTAGAALQTGGVYGRLRHPLYAGLLLAAAGRATWTGARRHRAAVVALSVLLSAKARYEERRLLALFPGYAGYAARTPAWNPVARRRGGG